MDEIPETVQRWTAKRRMTLVLSILKGETTVADAADRHHLSVDEVEKWRVRFLTGAENALRERPKDEEAVKDARIKQLERKIGELVVDMDTMREAMRAQRQAEGRPSED